MSVSLAPAAAHPAAPSRRLGRSVAAVVVALVANVVVTTATDQLFHVLDVYPPWGQPMPDAGDNALALAYRTVYAVLGGWLAARLAPRAPVRHALAYGGVGLVLSAIGAYVAITRFDLGPDWYPLLLVVVAVPAAWLGGALHGRRAGA
jgi:hypothetical protein